MGEGWYFRVLGPVTVEHDGVSVDVGGMQRRAVLGVLLLNANQVVSLDRLADAVWSGRPPASFRVQLQGVVSKLRAALGTDGRRETAPILTHSPGYELRLTERQIDLAEFRSDVAAAAARLRGGDAVDRTAAADLLRTALGRWRGPAFDGIDSEVLQHAAAELEEARLAALEERIEIEVALGRHGDVIAELGGLTRDHPLRERFHGQLMMALSHAGRLADALAVYRRLRERMVEDLGVEPSTRLQQLHRAILTGVTGRKQAEAITRSYVVPRQLPGDVPDLVGREELMDTAAELLTGDRGDPAAGTAAGTGEAGGADVGDRGSGARDAGSKDLVGEVAGAEAPRCVMVSGPGGVGKTAFALRLAHRLRDRFPDGQLFARLGGSGPDRATPGAVLSRFLHALGVPPGGVPADLDERSCLFRELLATRRVLVVLDDAAEEAQVRPLVPAEPRCAVLITSRRRLAGIETSRPLPLDVLPAALGLALLRRTAGARRISAEPAAAAEIVRRCGGLPLAIRIAGARLASRPNWTVADMAERLTADHARLDWLQLGDLGVRASLAETYATLGEAQQRLFRRLSLLPRCEFPGWVAAALLGQPAGDAGASDPGGTGGTGGTGEIGLGSGATGQGSGLPASTAQADRLLDDLVDVHLVEPAGRGVTGPRYRMHDLIALIAGERAAEEDRPDDRSAAVLRVLDSWLDLAGAADSQIPHWYGLDPAPAPPWRAPAGLVAAVRGDPLAWFDEERDALTGAVRLATEQGHARVAWPLAQHLSTYLDLRGHFDTWAHVLRHGLRAAEAAADQEGIACMLGISIDVETSLDRIDRGIYYAERTVAAYAALGDAPVATADPTGPERTREPYRSTRATASGAGATGADRPGRTPASQELAERERALERARRAGDPLDVCLATFRLLTMRRQAGVHEGYLQLWQEMRQASRECGAPRAELAALKNSGLTFLKQRRLAEAVDCLSRGQQVVESLGSQDRRLAEVLGDIALAYAAKGRFVEAESLTRDALEGARTGRHRWDEGRALDTLGILKQAQGDLAAALELRLEALALWRRLGATIRITHTMGALAELCEATGDTHAAALYRTQPDLAADPAGRTR